MHSCNCVVLAALALSSAGCIRTPGGNDAGPPDAGPPRPRDSGPPEGGWRPPDVGVPRPDSGPPDSGPSDAGTFDAGPPDSGGFDAGAHDSGAFDAGSLDAEPIDGWPPIDVFEFPPGVPDVGPPDAAPPDAGPPDSGVWAEVYADRDEWATHAECDPITVLYFDGPTELNLRYVDDVRIDPPYSSFGLEFETFRDTVTFPQILRGRDPDIVVPGHDALVTNRPSPHPRTDLDGRAIYAHFTRAIHSVGVWCNMRDGGYIEALDSTDTVLARAPISSGGFGGITSSIPIHRIRMVNTFDFDIIWGIYGLQFSGCAHESD